MVVSLSIINSI